MTHDDTLRRWFSQRLITFRSPKFGSVYYITVNNTKNDLIGNS